MCAMRGLAINAVLAMGLALSGAGAIAQPARNPSAASEQEVRAAEALRLKAFLDHDVKTMAALMADELVHTTSDGRTRDKSQFMADFANRPTAFSQFVTDQMDVIVIGDVAITRGRYHNVVAQRSYGTPLKYARFLRVWARRDGAWQLMSHQATEVGRPDK
ncbi:MAG TPA: nuclear transport factor 2 family protein [Xanthobacteraceae bacterium]|nr:nuclear transport factor 2 family protein [Xanthobacteraceae bacterium]